MLRTLRLFSSAFFRTLVRRMRRGRLRPSWSLAFEATVAFLRADWDDSAAWAWPRLRAEVEGRPYPRGALKRVRVEDLVLGGVPVRRFTPKARRHETVVLFFHGGSYIYGSAKTTHADLLARLAHASGCDVLGPEYRLAPEHPFPAQRDDALAVYDALLESGTPRERIVVAGDSAGGNLALLLQIALRERGSGLPRAAVLLSPWSDLTMPGASFTENDAYDFGTREVLVRQAEAYAGGVGLDDPRISPAHAALHALSPTLVVASECEIPRDDILALAAKLELSLVEVSRHIAEDMPHNSAVFAAYHPSAQRALEEMARFIERHAE